MPIYEYRCEHCEKITEVFQKVDDCPAEKCSHCGGSLHKVISHSTFILKGTGWYATDYAKKNVGGHKMKPPVDKTEVEKKDANGPLKETPTTGDSAATPAK
jgi:putative FmdB family regulatory protein